MVSMLVFKDVSYNFLLKVSKIRAFERCPKINLEPKNHPIEKEIHLPNHHFGYPSYFSGVYSQTPVGVTVLLFHRTTWGKIPKIRPLFEEECAILQDLGGAKKRVEGTFLRFFTPKTRT